jgi:serine/threonine-protein kinase
MTISSVATLIDVLRDNDLLSAAQLDEVSRDLQARFAEADGLARELGQRGWLTAYQVERLVHSQGKDLVLGQYVLLECLGEGGMGQVFKARHQRLERVVALKVIRKERLSNPDTVRRFRREARAAARLSHPNIVAIYDADEVDGTHFLAMEFVEGIDLYHLMQQRGSLPVAQACDYVRQAALGLQHAHGRGLIHRDIKPANLMLSAEGGVVKVLDMGLARLEQRTEEGDTASALTYEGAIMGTPDYIAPEQALDPHKADIRADLYSLGCTLYYLVAGRTPFVGGTLIQKLDKHRWEEPQPVEQARPEVPPELAAVVRRLMAKRPEDRYQTPGEVAAALTPFCTAEGLAVGAQVHKPPQTAEAAVTDSTSERPTLPPQPMVNEGSLPPQGPSLPPQQSVREPAKRDDKVVLERTRPTSKPPYRLRRAYWLPGLIALAMVGLGAALWLAWWFLSPPKTTHLVLVGAGYEDNLAVPHNVYGMKGLDDLAELARSDRALHVKHEPVELQRGVAWDRDLDKFSEKTVIVFLALHGGADEQSCYLLYHDSDLREEGRLRLSKVLERLDQPELKDKNKVLILDATQVAANWQAGMLHNDFARQLRGDFTDRIEQIPNLVVLSASDVDQRSWASEEWRQTVFAHYIIEGLRGAAADRNGRVDALSLYQYVAGNVTKWAWANRAALQTPVLLGGEERARGIELVVVRGKYQPADAEVPVFQVPTMLTAAWQSFRDLQQQVPPPAAYAPHLWRQYQETLLRYEQLIRAGDTRKTTDVYRRLNGLKDEIGKARAVDRPSAQFALPLPVALGKTSDLFEDKDVKDKFNQLWTAKDDGRSRTWEDMEKDAGERSRELRLQLCGLFLDRAAVDPQQNLRKAADLLHILCWKGNERPAELHFLAMLQAPDNLAPDRPPADLLATALKVRALAENVALAIPLDRAEYRPRQRPTMHPYSEQVFPWIQAKVLRADEQRQQGQDLLFADKDSWGKARQLLADAEKLYREAQDDAAAVRGAMQTRDEVFAALPYYSLWLAERRSPEDEHDQDSASLKDFEDLWKNVHLLSELLEEKPQPERVDKLRSRAKAVDKPFRQIQNDFETRCDKLSKESTNLPKFWRDIDDALRVPGLDPQVRKALLENQRRISRRLHDGTGTKGKGMNQDQTSKQARDSGQRQGRLALAVLGESWFDLDPVFKSRLKEFEVKRLLVELQVDAQWPATLGRTGEEIGLRWRDMPAEITQRVEKSHTEGPVDQMAQDLGLAERLARQIDGAAAARLKREIRPVEEIRKVRLHNLLLWLADRTRNDHWFAEEPGQPTGPYYRYVGLCYVQDAGSLVEGKNDPLTPTQRDERTRPAMERESDLNRPGEVLAVNQPDIDMATEKEVSAMVPIAYPLRLAEKLGKKGWVPAGYPVVWLEKSKYLEPVAKPRQVLEVQNETLPESVSFGEVPVRKVDPYPVVPQKDEEKVALGGFYRGQRIKAETVLRLHRVPETVAYHHQPRVEDTGIIVGASRKVFAPQNAAIAIVLDASGSMGNKEVFEGKKPWDRQTPCKYHEATTALREVLSKLPEGTSVSLFVFSHKPGQDKIQRIRPPTPWDPRKELDAFMGQVEMLEPYSDTPLLRTMERANREGFPRDFKGIKTMLVLTDGGDSEVKPSESSTRLVKEFENSGVLINTVRFKLEFDTKQEEEAAEEFQKVFEKGLLPLKGKIYDVKEPKKLAKSMQEALRRRLSFRVEDHSGHAVKHMPEEGWPVDGAPSPIHLDPGGYVVKVPDILKLSERSALKQDIQLEKGQYLRITITDDSQGFEMELFRDDYQKSPHKVFRRSNGEEWLLTAQQNEFKDRAGELEMMLALEATDGHVRQRDTLRHPTLRTWLEVTPQGADGGAPVALRWGALARYTVPAWGVNVAGWPVRGGPVVPAVSTWFIWGRDPHPLATLDRRGVTSFRKAFVGADGRVDLGDAGGNQAQIDSVELAKLQMEVEPGKYTEQSCLVVRASFPKRQGR